MISKQFAYICLGATLTRHLHQVSHSYIAPSTTTVQQGRSLRPDDDYDDGNHKRKPKLGDGCRHVFLDVGSNIGVHARMLFEPHLYPPPPKKKNRRLNSSANNKQETPFSARTFFASQFGPEDARDNTEFCIFAFEPNPAHIKRHEEMERAYHAMGWRYHFLHGGVSDEDSTTLTFYHIGKGNKELERGFTTVKERCRRDCRPEEVMVYRLSDWIDDEIHGRIIPDHTSSGVRVEEEEEEEEPPRPPRVVMKMDIEMGEWLVFPDLLTSGVLCRDIDTLLGEFHLKTHEDDYPIHFPHRGNWTLDTYQQAQVLKDEMFGMVRRNPYCRTELVEGDDESYGTDGMPWPKPPPLAAAVNS